VLKGLMNLRLRGIIIFLLQDKHQRMKNNTVVWVILLIVLGFQVNIIKAQEAETATEESTEWLTGGSFGLDFTQLLLVNPKIGGGENKLGFGGLNALFAKYKSGKSMWDSEGVIQLGVQRLGSKDNPFTKNIDVLRLSSKYGYQLSNKWYGGFLLGFESLLLNTFDDLALSSTGSNTLQAKFLSPASFSFGPGFDFVDSGKFSVFFSPFAYQTVIVLDDKIAALGVHGNPWTSATDFKNIKHEVGAKMKAQYADVFFEKLNYKGEFNLFYDYLAEEHGVEFVDIIFINDFGIQLFKGLSLNLLLDLRWDRDIASVVPDGENQFKKWMVSEAMVIKYNYVFE
jgi:hypothetical protein